MQTIKEFFFKRALKRQKEQAVFELRTDLEYISKFKGDMLDYNESNARTRMASLKRKEATEGTSLTEVEAQELEAILDMLAHSKAVKNEYEKTSKVLEDCLNYISLL